MLRLSKSEINRRTMTNAPINSTEAIKRLKINVASSGYPNSEIPNVITAKIVVNTMILEERLIFSGSSSASSAAALPAVGAEVTIFSPAAVALPATAAPLTVAVPLATTTSVAPPPPLLAAFSAAAAALSLAPPAFSAAAFVPAAPAARPSLPAPLTPLAPSPRLSSSSSSSASRRLIRPKIRDVIKIITNALIASPATSNSNVSASLASK